MLSKETVIDSIQVLEDGTLQVRRADRYLENGEEVARRYHRHALAPGDELGAQNVLVAAVARAVWTAEVVASYQGRKR